MRLYVTGSTGFVGGVLQEVVRLDEQWRHVRLITDPSVNVLDGAALGASVREYRPDAILHLAGRSNVSAAISSPVETAQINVIGTINLLEAIEKHVPTARLVFAGSSDAYGMVQEAQLPVTEDQPLMPRNPYAASKAAAEQFVLERARRSRLDACCTRSFNHTGPGQLPNFVIPAIARQLAQIARSQQRPTLVTGDLDITRDFLDVRDVLQAYLCLLTAQNVAGKVFNVCSGVETHLREVARRMAEIAGLEVTFERDPALLRPAEQRRMCGNHTRLSELGWQPRIPFDNTLHAVVSHWMQQI
jgi:GDP-4-dehydro-6-deoxy-D-mannose reductase